MKQRLNPIKKFDGMNYVDFSPKKRERVTAEML